MKQEREFLYSLTGVLLLTGFYLILYQLWYGATPMGLDPVLDGKQNLLTAEKVLQGDTFEQPFHRAPLYPYLLALLQKINLLGLSVPALARLMNSAAVLLSTYLAATLSWQVWKRLSSVWITGILVGLNPVILFFAGDPLDISLATTCFIATAWILFTGYKAESRVWLYWLAGGLVLGMGMAMRSHLMLLCLLWPFIAGLGALRNRHTRKLSLISAAILLGMVGPLLAFLGIGIANKTVSDEFRMTPWGGPFLLWAGNGPMNNGRYYAQSVRVEFEGDYENPTIYESIYHYQQLTGKEPPFEVDDMNAFFIKQTFIQVWKDPGAWIGLMFKKVYSLIHNYEQYDNKTFSLHKQISPYLALNPIGWGLILTLATLAGVMLFFSRKTTFWGTVILMVLYALMVLATFTANRYRVPLIPILAVLAGGIPKIYFRRDQFTRRGAITMALVTACVGVLTFIPFAGIAEKDTYLADFALLANASHRQGADLEAVEWAERALVIDPDRDDLKEVAALSTFNHWFTQSENTPTASQASKWLEELEQLNRASPALAFAQAVYLWKLGDHANACSLWEFAVNEYRHPGSIEALVWNCEVDQSVLERLPRSSWERILAIKMGDGSIVDPPLSEEQLQTLADIYRIAYEPFPEEATDY